MPRQGKQLSCVYEAKLALSPFAAFYCHSQLPKTCSLCTPSRTKHWPGRAAWQLEGGKCPPPSCWPALPISGISRAAVVAPCLVWTDVVIVCSCSSRLLALLGLQRSYKGRAAVLRHCSVVPWSPSVLMHAGVSGLGTAGQPQMACKALAVPCSLVLVGPHSKEGTTSCMIITWLIQCCQKRGLTDASPATEQP